MWAGAVPPKGPEVGIHWHMNIANKIEYIATDDRLLSIPWVRMTNEKGVTTEYHTPEFKGNPSQYRIRRMDCMDCHSRPAHKVHTPNDAVDLALATGRIDPGIPWAKSKVVAALVHHTLPRQKLSRKSLPRYAKLIRPQPGGSSYQ